jgi:hypothetical protein
MSESIAALTDPDLISYLKSFPDARMRRKRSHPSLVFAAGGGLGMIATLPASGVTQEVL